MTKQERVRYEMLLRVRDYGTAHTDRFPESSSGAQAFATVASLVAEIDAHETNRLVAVRESRRLKTDRRKLMVDRMRAIVRTSKAVRSVSGSPLRLMMPRRTSDIAIVSAAHAFLHETEPYQDQLLTLGLPANYLTQLRETTDAFDAALKARRDGRMDVSRARAGLKAALALGTDTARTLDVIVTNLLGADPVAMAAWERVRRLVDGRPKPEGAAAPVASPATVPPVVTPPPNAATPADPPVEPLRRAS